MIVSAGDLCAREGRRLLAARSGPSGIIGHEKRPRKEPKSLPHNSQPSILDPLVPAQRRIPRERHARPAERRRDAACRTARNVFGNWTRRSVCCRGNDAAAVMTSQSQRGGRLAAGLGAEIGAGFALLFQVRGAAGRDPLCTARGRRPIEPTPPETAAAFHFASIVVAAASSLSPPLWLLVAAVVLDGTHRAPSAEAGRWPQGPGRGPTCVSCRSRRGLRLHGRAGARRVETEIMAPPASTTTAAAAVAGASQRQRQRLRRQALFAVVSAAALAARFEGTPRRRIGRPPAGPLLPSLAAGGYSCCMAVAVAVAVDAASHRQRWRWMPLVVLRQCRILS
jgi:hypothetical protein